MEAELYSDILTDFFLKSLSCSLTQFNPLDCLNVLTVNHFHPKPPTTREAWRL